MWYQDLSTRSRKAVTGASRTAWKWDTTDTSATKMVISHISPAKNGNIANENRELLEAVRMFVYKWFVFLGVPPVVRSSNPPSWGFLISFSKAQRDLGIGRQDLWLEESAISAQYIPIPSDTHLAHFPTRLPSLPGYQWSHQFEAVGRSSKPGCSRESPGIRRSVHKCGLNIAHFTKTYDKAYSKPRDWGTLFSDKTT